MNIKAIITIVLIIVALGFLLQQDFIRKHVLEFLNQNSPWVIPLFTFIKDNITSGSLIGLFLFLLFASIPILPSPPAEAYTIFSLSKGANIFGIIFITILVYLLFAVIYYFIGRFFGQRVLEKIFKRPIGHIPFLGRFIGPLIFFAHLLPIPLPIPLATILILISGFYKTDFRKVMVAVGMGTLFRVLIVASLYYFNAPFIENYLSTLKLLKIG